MLRVVCTALTLAALSAPALHAQTGTCKVLVLTVEGRALPEADNELPALLTETLANEVGVVTGCAVMSQQDIKAMMNYEKEKAICGDGSDSCLAEIGAAYGADRVVAGTLGKLGADYVLSVRRLDVARGAVERRSEQPPARAKEQLHRAAKNAARAVFDTAPLPERAPAQAGSPLRTWGGLALVGAGATVAVAGGAGTGMAEARLNDPAARDKDGVRQLGRVALIGGAIGLALAAGGGALLLWGPE